MLGILYKRIIYEHNSGAEFKLDDLNLESYNGKFLIFVKVDGFYKFKIFIENGKIHRKYGPAVKECCVFTEKMYIKYWYKNGIACKNKYGFDKEEKHGNSIIKYKGNEKYYYKRKFLFNKLHLVISEFCNFDKNFKKNYSKNNYLDYYYYYYEGNHRYPIFKFSKYSLKYHEETFENLINYNELDRYTYRELICLEDFLKNHIFLKNINQYDKNKIINDITERIILKKLMGDMI